MGKPSIALASAILMAATVGCSTATKSADTTAASSASSTSTAAPAPTTAQGAAEAIKVAIPQITEIITITESNDFNNLIGRDNGYVAATVLVDPRAGTDECDLAKPGIACGAGVEQWPDAAAAQQRADYIKEMKSSMPILGTEYATLRDNLLLRVSGKLKPSEAEAYKAAFLG
jgi:hypothetical protein